MHSPVFRIGGDEFVSVLTERDYLDRERLLKKFCHRVSENQRKGQGPVVSIGMSEYDAKQNDRVAEIFETADQRMYENKRMLKQTKDVGVIEHEKRYMAIPENERKNLDSVFEVLDLMSENRENKYVFLCNMKYDYSRWSKSAVQDFCLPAEYMHEAGVIWENYVHPDDLEKYRASMERIFQDTYVRHDIQYRIRERDGVYRNYICKGMVFRDGKGEPIYFGGFISADTHQ